MNYRLRLDALKKVAELKGGECSKANGWYGLKGACKRGKKGEGDRKAKDSRQAIADRIRARKGLTTIRSRDGKLKDGKWDIGAAFAPGNEQQSSIRASRTGPNNNRTLNPDRASRMRAKEEIRARVNWGRTTGDWKQTPDSTAAMDMPKLPTVEVLEQKWAKAFTEMVETPKSVVTAQDKARAITQSKAKQPVAQLADGSVVMARHTERQAKSQAKTFFPEGFTLDAVPEAWEGKTYVPAHWLARQKVTPNPTPIESGKSLKALFSEADRVGAKYQTEPPTMAERRTAKAKADRILQESGVDEAVARASGVASMEKKRSAIPMKVPGMVSRSSNEPRKKGRSVD